MGKIYRDAYWDTLKFVLISLVVLGHTLEMNIPDASFNRALYNTIYLFHMPLFIFVSGRFSQIKERQKYKRGIFKLVETYIVFQILRSLILPSLLGETLNWKYIVVPNWIMWYLMSLIWWRLFVYYIPSHIIREKRVEIIIVSVLICLLSGFIPIGHPLEFQRTLVFFPFFITGFYSTEIDVKEKLSRIPIGWCIFFFLLVFAIFYYFLNFNLSWLLSAGQHYWDSIPPMWMRIVSRIIYLPFAFGACVCSCRLIKTNQWFSKWGGQTMFIYIYHPYILDVIKFYVRDGKIDSCGASLYLYAVGVIAVLLLLSKIKFFHKLLNPLSKVCQFF